MGIFLDQRRQVACPIRPLAFAPARSERETCLVVSRRGDYSAQAGGKGKSVMHSHGSCQTGVLQVSTPSSASGRI